MTTETIQKSFRDVLKPDEHGRLRYYPGDPSNCAICYNHDCDRIVEWPNIYNSPIIYACKTCQQKLSETFTFKVLSEPEPEEEN